MASENRLSRIGERSVSGAFASLLALTGDAVLVFDGAGKIMLANDEASALLCPPKDGFVGSDVRLLFPPAVGVAPQEPFTLSSLPFVTDGSARRLSCLGAHGMLVDVVVRCDKVRAPGDTYLLVARADNREEAAERDHERLVEELSRANKRLSGTLSIVLGTLGAPDVNTLFSQVLNEIRDTMEATGTIVYLAETDGFHLRGASDGLNARSLSRFVPYGKGIEQAISRTGKALRFRVLPPDRASLRKGRVRSREVLDEETHEVRSFASSVLPPFASFVAVPVWFGGHIIAIIEVGWREVHPTRREDAQLLDAVAEYLSVQLMGAFATLRAQHAERLDNLASSLREHLVSASETTPELVDDVIRSSADELQVDFVRLDVESSSDGMVAELPVQGTREIPLTLEQVRRASGCADDAVVVPLDPDGELSRWLRDEGEPCRGALVDVGEVSGDHLAYLALRSSGAEPLLSIELDFLERVVHDVREAAAGSEARTQDKRISQALQSGMRNELQKVDGISAQGIYSSATAAAFVGGDFYDLIRLPDRRACVIMGDVSGKGVEAASVSAAVKTALGAYAWEGLSPASMVRALNEFLLSFSRIETFATLFVGIIDLAAGTITYCSAGHPPAVLLHGRDLVMLDVQSGVVGAFHDMHYEDGVAPVVEGDVLVLYTDGTTEARDPGGDFFGEDGLRDMLVAERSRGFEGLCDRMMATLDRFTGNNLEDDVALVALRFDAVGD